MHREERGHDDISEYQEDLARVEAAARTIGDEVEKLNIELQAPHRIVLVEHAEGN